MCCWRLTVICQPAYAYVWRDVAAWKRETLGEIDFRSWKPPANYLPDRIWKRLEIVPFVVVWMSLRWRERIDGTIGTYPATLSNSGYNSAPYWGTSYYCCRRVLAWLLDSLSGWKRSCFNPNFNPRNFCAPVNDLEWGGKLLPIIFTNIGILFRKIPNFTPK